MGWVALSEHLSSSIWCLHPVHRSIFGFVLPDHDSGASPCKAGPEVEPLQTADAEFFYAGSCP